MFYQLGYDSHTAYTDHKMIHLIPTLPQLKELSVSDNKLPYPDPNRVEMLKQTADVYPVGFHT